MTPSTPFSRARAGVRKLAFLGVLAAALAVPAGASADGPAVIVKLHQASGITSTYFQLHGRPGETVQAGSLELDNPTAHEAVVALDPVDAITTDTLGSAYELSGHHAHRSTTWLKLPARRVRLAAYAQVVLPVALVVPPTAASGDYLSGISVEALNQVHPARISHGLMIGETDRYAVGVELSVPGPRHPLIGFTGAGVRRDPSGVVFALLARNGGNVILKDVHGSALVTSGRRVVARTVITPGTFVSGTSIAYPVRTPREQPAEGTSYRVRATLYYAGGVAHLDTMVTFGHAAAVAQQHYGGPSASRGGIDWALWIGLGLGALILAAFLFLLWRRRRRLVTSARALALLERELAAARSGKRPLSVVHLEVNDASRASRRRIAAALRQTLRKSDLVCDLGGDGLLIALPGTGPVMASGLACEIKDVLEREARGAEVASIGASTATDGLNPHELIAQARRDRRADDMYTDV